MSQNDDFKISTYLNGILSIPKTTIQNTKKSAAGVVLLFF